CATGRIGSSAWSNLFTGLDSW
nr:immunoglobulin heavy chain junction region [Macaca mulatta]MOX59955.1 immunoglobulin heavy chain junction region [Macaca mulatta]MOX61018.1 immunoglobulin heavy chain junction region [Macaca mulatta]MOX61417.1 immunoglobulin heavy chain junction region [Macaca mulatta]MOX61801.1 immunoglobulin heavy chain junction region [Macaca mulatta]